MSATLDARSRYLSQFDRAKPSREAGWLKELRQAAIARFMQAGFPTSRDEEWKYTDVSALEKAAFELPAGAPLPVAGVEGFFFPGLDCHAAVFVNGRFAPGPSLLGALPRGVVVAGLGGVLTNDPEAAEPFLSRYAHFQAGGFTALNTAFVRDGGYVRIPRGVTVEQPILLLFITVAGGGAPVTHPRNLIVAEPGSRARVVERYVSGGEGMYFTNAVTEIAVAEDAWVEHVKVQEEGRQAFHVATIQAHQAGGSRFDSHSHALGALLARNDINTVLAGEGASCNLYGLYAAGGRSHVDHHTRIDHLAARGTSREFYKGILDGRARGVFNGKVIVHPGARKTDALQTNRNLLLSPDAEVDTKPQLEIFADDVKCSHGATVGQLDEDKVFYLRSRGVDRDAARSLLTYAFAAEVLRRLETGPVRHALEQALMARLPQGAAVRAFFEE
jgi:Fe-S cluster assembly protein SufD